MVCLHFELIYVTLCFSSTETPRFLTLPHDRNHLPAPGLQLKDGSTPMRIFWSSSLPTAEMFHQRAALPDPHVIYRYLHSGPLWPAVNLKIHSLNSVCVCVPVCTCCKRITCVLLFCWKGRGRYWRLPPPPPWCFPGFALPQFPWEGGLGTGALQRPPATDSSRNLVSSPDSSAFISHSKEIISDSIISETVLIIYRALVKVTKALC